MPTTSAHKNRALVWIRRDLRIKDHRALAHALSHFKEVLVVFVFDTEILRHLTDKEDRRLVFINEALVGIDETLKRKDSALYVKVGDPRKEIPRFAKDMKVTHVFCNHDYEPSAIKRDQVVAECLQGDGIQFQSFKDQCIFEKDEILNQSGKPFKVFTAYKNEWLKQFPKENIAEEKPRLENLVPISKLPYGPDSWSLEKIGFKNIPVLIHPKEGPKLLVEFGSRIQKYKTERDFPSLNGTSSLSPYLRFGIVSVRACVRLALTHRSAGADTWLSELIWRDFYMMMLSQFPYVAKSCFKKECDSIEWPGSEAHFKAWCNGETGFPIVDAAMRQLNQTGWMHNRLRMIVASFLCKDLLVDYKKGEHYFARKLLDFDLSANNGGWQWSASTGADAQPFFRVFNPTLQSQKFDPKGVFIRTYCPELQDVPDSLIHEPHRLGKEINYPKPIVDHKVQREKAIALFKKL